MAEAQKCPECKPGAPMWMTTFADLMALLMCFFVLLLSFSEIDLLKYKQLAGSMASAFGVQAQVTAREIPKGTSIIAQEFSPGRPEPTPINEVRQATSDDSLSTLDISAQGVGEGAGAEGTGQEEAPPASLDDEQAKQLLLEKLRALVAETEDDARKLASALQREISTGRVEIETRGRQIVIRVREQGSFPSGSAELRPGFIPVMASVREVLRDISGKIAVEGHTDSVPISTNQFRSNWDLSAARALSVSHELFRGNTLDQNRFLVTGYADTKPLMANDSEENRLRNRRVEIVIRQGLDDETGDELKQLQQTDPDLVRDLNLDTPFILSPDEVF